VAFFAAEVCDTLQWWSAAEAPLSAHRCIGIWS
jgi:hypothetical protein